VRRRQARVGARLTGKMKELLDGGATTEPVSGVAGTAPTNAR
jgi:hypothetical protein